MKIVKAGYQIYIPGREAWKDKAYRTIEFAARTCYKSDDKITPDSAGKLIRQLIANGHDAMLEHASMTVRFRVDRGVSHELVRHRLFSFAQESTRYCNYGNAKFGGELTFIEPCFWEPESEAYQTWKDVCLVAEGTYLRMVDAGVPPEQARTVLPTSLKTEVIVTGNMREWRHFFKLRAVGTTGKPHPQMAEVAAPLLLECAKWMPELFADLSDELMLSTIQTILTERK